MVGVENLAGTEVGGVRTARDSRSDGKAPPELILALRRLEQIGNLSSIICHYSYA